MKRHFIWKIYQPSN